EVAIVTPVQIGEEDVRRAAGIELRHKNILVAAQSRLQRMRRGEVERLGPPRYIGITSSVHGNAGAIVKAAAAQVGGVDQRRAAGIELRHKSNLGAAESRLRRMRCREVGRLGRPRYIG